MQSMADCYDYNTSLLPRLSLAHLLQLGAEQQIKCHQLKSTENIKSTVMARTILKRAPLRSLLPPKEISNKKRAHPFASLSLVSQIRVPRVTRYYV